MFAPMRALKLFRHWLSLMQKLPDVPRSLLKSSRKGHLRKILCMHSLYQLTINIQFLPPLLHAERIFSNHHFFLMKIIYNSSFHLHLSVAGENLFSPHQALEWRRRYIHRMYTFTGQLILRKCVILYVLFFSICPVSETRKH